MRKLQIAAVIILISFTAVAIYSVVNRDNKIKFQDVQIQSKQSEIKQLKLEYDLLNKKQNEAEQKHNLSKQELEQLRKEKEELLKKTQELEQQLSAKREAQRLAKLDRPAVAYASSGGSCAEWKASAGIASTTATMTLINKESGCRPNAVNPKSGACGIPQAYPCSKLPCPLNESGAVCQLQWMDQYVKNRYGSWEGALSFWYAQCGTSKGCWY